MQVIGIDISKDKFDVALFGREKTKSFANNSQGFVSLKLWIEKNGYEKVWACMEATGFYGEVLAEFLYVNGYDISVVNPACIKAYSQSKLSRHKTDRVDAILIAEYANKQKPHLWKPCNPKLKELKELYRCSQALKIQLTQVNNQLENQRLMLAVKKVWKALKLQLEKQIKNIELNAIELIMSSKELKEDYINLQTIPGIGKITAIAILAEVPELTLFRNARQLAAYAGLIPRHKTSGSTIRGKARLSKIGSANLRKALYFPALTAVTYNPIIKAFHDKLKKKGKHTLAILGAAMRKLLHIIYGILKTKQPFNPILLASHR